MQINSKAEINDVSKNILHPIYFNQHSTDQLLRELKISLKDVEAIIEKSK